MVSDLAGENEAHWGDRSFSSGLFEDLAVNFHVLQNQLSDANEHVRFVHVVKDAILQVDAGYWRTVITADGKGIFTFFADCVFQIDIANGRWVLAGVAFSIEEVNLYHGLGDLADCDISQIDIIDRSAANRVGFDTQGPFEIRAVHSAVFGEDISGASGHFAADDHTAVSVFHAAISDNDIFTRHIDPSAIVVSAGLYGNAIVSGVKITIFDEYIAA